MDKISDNSIQLNFTGGEIEIGVIGSSKRFKVEKIESFIEILVSAYRDDDMKIIKKILKDLESRTSAKFSPSSSVSVTTYLRMMKENLYMDYSQYDKVKELDRERSKKDFEEKKVGHFDRESDKNDNIVKSMPCNEIESIVSSCFRPVARAKFYDLYEVFLTPVPSNGARHPFYPLFIHKKNIYCYFPKSDSLRLLTTISNSMGLKMLIVCNMEKMQARYPHSITFNDILLEYGHILANLNLQGKSKGFTMYYCNSDTIKEEIDLKKEEEIFGCFNIDNINPLDSLEDFFNLGRRFDD